MPLPSGLFDIFKPWERVEFHFEWVRVFTILLGLSGVVWGATNFATLWRQLGIERIAAKILDRETFKPNALVPFIPALEEIEQSHYCRPQSVRSAAIIRLRLAEEALAAGERATVDERLSTLDSSIRKALACEPADPFLWMVLASSFHWPQQEFLTAGVCRHGHGSYGVDGPSIQVQLLSQEPVAL